MSADSIPLKRCSRCRNLFPTTSEYFNKCEHAKDGLRWQCKRCMVEIRREHRDYTDQYNQQYRTSHREQIRSHRKEYYQDNKDVLLSKKREAYKVHRYTQLQVNRKWRLNHPDQAAEIARQAKHRRRARKHDAIGSHTSTDIDILYINQHGLCAYCSTPLHGKYHVDHIVPLSRGGTDYAENLTLTCPRCNLSKGDKLLSEWKH